MSDDARAYGAVASSRASGDDAGSRPSSPKRDTDTKAIVLDLAPPDPVVEAFIAPVAARLTCLKGDLRDPVLWVRLPAVSHVAHGAAVTSINRLTAAYGL